MAMASGTVEPRRQLVDRPGGLRMIGNTETKHGGIAQPEGQAGDETDLRHLDRIETIRRIDAVTHGAAGEYGCADIVADRIAGEAGERGNAIGNFSAADGSQGKPVIKGQCEIAASNKECGGGNMMGLGCL